MPTTVYRRRPACAVDKRHRERERLRRKRAAAKSKLHRAEASRIAKTSAVAVEKGESCMPLILRGGGAVV